MDTNKIVDSTIEYGGDNKSEEEIPTDEMDYSPFYKCLTEHFKLLGCPQLLYLPDDPSCFCTMENSNNKKKKDVIYFDPYADDSLAELKRICQNPISEGCYADDDLEQIMSFSNLHGLLYEGIVPLSKILRIPAPELRIRGKAPDDNKRLMGYTRKIEDEHRNIILVVVPDDIQYMMIAIGTLAHEMRHLWQRKYDPDILNNYIEPENGDYLLYSLNPAEIDADAFACLCLKHVFHFTTLEPFLNTTNETAQKAIRKRMKEIKPGLMPLLKEFDIRKYRALRKARAAK